MQAGGSVTPSPVDGFRLGVDFGTTNTVAALAWPDGQVQVGGAFSSAALRFTRPVPIRSASSPIRSGASTTAG
jgi:hypothetical protein